MVLEIVGAILATSTAKSVIRFVDEKVSEYVNKKFGNKPTVDVEALKKEVEELKRRLEPKEREEITQTDIEEVKKTIAKIEQEQSSLSDTIISDLIFQEWSEKKLTVEDRAPIIKREMEMLVEKAKELKISERKRWEIQDVIIAIDINLNEMIEALSRERKYRLTADAEKARAAKIALENTMIEASILLKPYYSSK